MPHRPPPWRTIAASASLVLSCAASAREPVSTLTFVEGKSTITAGAVGVLPAAGLRLRRCDIVHTGPTAMMQIELDDGGQILLGPDTRLLVEPASAGDTEVGPHYLLSGWAKITVPRRDKAATYRFDTPHLELLIDVGVTVLRVGADGAQFFVEQGSALARLGSGASQARDGVRAGRTYTRRSDQDRGVITDGLDATFAKAVPRALRESLPSLLARLKNRDVEPKPGPTHSQADADEWLRRVASLQACAADESIRAAQEALERKGFDVGPIDGVLGPRTQAALREFQQRQGLPRSGMPDAGTLKSLGVDARR